MRTRLLMGVWRNDGSDYTNISEAARVDAVIGVVPIMGALHQGHLSLVRAAKEVCDRVIVIFFLYPKQFNNQNDLENYPRTEHDDAKKLASFEVDAIYVPDADQIYPDGFATNVSVSWLTGMLCGAARPASRRR